MLNWLKGLLNPKSILKSAVDALDLLEAPLAAEIEKIKAKFGSMTSYEQATWIVDQVQAFLRKKFNLSV